MPLPLAETAPSARVALSPGEVSPSALVLANGVAPGTRLLEDSSFFTSLGCPPPPRSLWLPALQPAVERPRAPRRHLETGGAGAHGRGGAWCRPPRRLLLRGRPRRERLRPPVKPARAAAAPGALGTVVLHCLALTERIGDRCVRSLSTPVNRYG
jgi:hypothetical protein